MVSIPIIPAVAGLTCGLSAYPIIFTITSFVKRRSALKMEETRLKETSFILSGEIHKDTMLRDIRNLMSGKRQGVLHIFTGRRKGYILFRNGEVIDIFYRNSSGDEALVRLFELEEGEYYFESRAVYQPTLFTGNMVNLLKNIEEED